jgi:hypothetical protein
MPKSYASNPSTPSHRSVPLSTIHEPISTATKLLKTLCNFPLPLISVALGGRPARMKETRECHAFLLDDIAPTSSSLLASTVLGASLDTPIENATRLANGEVTEEFA